MITCLGLVVGAVESADPQDVINMCTVWFKKMPHLLELNPEIIIDSMVFATVRDSFEDNGELYVLCRTYNGRTVIGIA